MNLTRRGFLGSVTTGMAGIGLVDLLARHASAGQGDNQPIGGQETSWRPGVAMTHHPAKAKRVLQIFCPVPHRTWTCGSTSLRSPNGLASRYLVKKAFRPFKARMAT